MEKTIFEKIIDGELPSTKIYENDAYLAFLDIFPVSIGHILIIPKKRYVWIQDVPDDLLAEMFIGTKRLIHALKDSLGCDYVQVSVVGEQVPHFHIHLIPRYKDDGFKNFPTLKYKDEGEKNIVAEKIKSSLN